MVDRIKSTALTQLRHYENACVYDGVKGLTDKPAHAAIIGSVAEITKQFNELADRNDLDYMLTARLSVKSATHAISKVQ